MQRSHLLAQAYSSDSHGQQVVIAFTVYYQLNMHVKYHLPIFKSLLGRYWDDNRCSHHLQLYLDAQRLLLDCRHACGEGLPHASCPTQGEL